MTSSRLFFGDRLHADRAFFKVPSTPAISYRHYFQDKGHFPESMRRDMELPNARAGVLPYVALAAGALVVWLSSRLTVIT